MHAVRRCGSSQVYASLLAAAARQLQCAACSGTANAHAQLAAHSTAAAQPAATSSDAEHGACKAADRPAAASADAVDGAFVSLHEAARWPVAVRRLDLTASPQLRCSNLLCDKVGEPCICRISRVFEQLGVVEVLILRGNAFTELPPSTWQLSSLRALDLSDNRLAALPPDIAGLQQLQVLKLTGNDAQLRLPYAALAALPELRELYVDRGIRQAMIRDPAVAPLLHWLRF